jgi:alkylation response protein AidB-like acyl-CoA dehydrogenase
VTTALNIKSQPLSFLAEPSAPSSFATPATLSEEHEQIARAARDFMEREVIPRSDELEIGNPETAKQLLLRAGQAGIAGALIPERFGGLGGDVTTIMLIAAEVARQESFGGVLGAHYGIGSLPLILFGTDAQRERYLPDIASARCIAAFALTEPGAGSDALGIRTKATRLSDGSFVLNGQKQFITNAGIANLYTVFAKLEGQFTAFLVPADAQGLSVGSLEKKLGMHGSPTASLSLEDVHIPADHLLGEVGKGHRIALNCLNIGRLKQGFGGLGGSREALHLGATYATTRKQFGEPIARFGIIRKKLADIAASGPGESSIHDTISALKTHSTHGAIAKVLGTETIAFAVDEALQIHGGYGYMEEYGLARMYRDIRVMRIFEGTNEINRLLIANALMHGAKTGSYDVSAPQQRASASLGAFPANLRWALACIVATLNHPQAKTQAESQAVLSEIANLAIELFSMDTVVARANSDESADDLLLLATESSRSRVMASLTTLGSLLPQLDLQELLLPFMTTSARTAQAIESVAQAVIERRLL